MMEHVKLSTGTDSSSMFDLEARVDSLTPSDGALKTLEESALASPQGIRVRISPSAKILPNEFMVNDDAADAGGGATNAFVTFDDDHVISACILLGGV